MTSRPARLRAARLRGSFAMIGKPPGWSVISTVKHVDLGAPVLAQTALLRISSEHCSVRSDALCY